MSFSNPKQPVVYGKDLGRNFVMVQLQFHFPLLSSLAHVCCCVYYSKGLAIEHKGHKSIEWGIKENNC